MRLLNRRGEVPVRELVLAAGLIAVAVCTVSLVLYLKRAARKEPAPEPVAPPAVVVATTAPQQTVLEPAPPKISGVPDAVIAPLPNPQAARPSPPRTTDPAAPMGTEPPRAVEHFPIDISKAFNAFIGETWKRENHDDDGLPADGRILVPSVVPRAYFQIVLPEAPNAIEVPAGATATVVIPPEKRGHYGRLAILSGSSKGNSTVHVTLHYDSGPDGTDTLSVQDWNRRGVPKEVHVHKALQAGTVQLYSQIVKPDATRVIETITFQAESNAVIFAITAIVSADRPFDGSK